MIAAVLLALFAFAITFAEEAVSSQLTIATVKGKLRRAIYLAGLFELILVLDVWLLVGEKWIAVPIVAGAMVGRWYGMTHRKKKRRSVKRIYHLERHRRR